MTGPASHHLAATEALFIDLVHYFDHVPGNQFPRRILLPLRIGAPGANVAVSTTHVQGGRKQAHGSHELVDGKTFQDFNILENVVSHLRLGLCEGDAREGQCGAQPCHGRAAVYQ